MNFQEFNQFFTTDFNLDGIVSVRQTWNAGSRYSRMETPRLRHGLFLMTDYPAAFELPDGEKLLPAVGDVLLLPKGANYAFSFSLPEGKAAHPLVVNFHLTDAEGKEILLDRGVTRLCRDNGTLLPLFTAAAQLYKSASPARLKSTVYALFDAIFPIPEADECRIGYINRHYTDRFHIPRLAAACAMSETAYRKRFRELTGASPVQYINRLKIEKACQMLRSGDISLREISDFLNFYNLPYFYKVFRENTGLTPAQYRSRAQTGS